MPRPLPHAFLTRRDCRLRARSQARVERRPTHEHGGVAAQGVERRAARVEQAQELGGHEARAAPAGAQGGGGGGEVGGPEAAPEVLQDGRAPGEQGAHDHLHAGDVLGR